MHCFSGCEPTATRALVIIAVIESVEAEGDYLRHTDRTATVDKFTN